MSEFTINVSGLEAVRKRFKSVNNFFNSKEPMQNIVSNIKENILTKTEQGHDYMGRNFRPYSPAYAAWRREHGLTTRVNLRVTGEMMDSIDAEVIDPRHGRVFINGPRALIAFYHTKGGPRAGRPHQRDFFNISKSALQKMWVKYRDDVVMRLLGRR